MLLAVKSHLCGLETNSPDKSSFEQSLTAIAEHKGTLDIAGDPAPI